MQKLYVSWEWIFWSVITAPGCFPEKKITRFLKVVLVPIHCNSLIICIVIARVYHPWNTPKTSADICLLTENSNKNTEAKCKVCSALGLTLGHGQEGSLAHPILITTQFQVRPEDYCEPLNEVGSQSLTERISGIRARIFPILSVTCYPTVSLSAKVY